MGPFGILERVGERAYRVALPPSLAGVNSVFYVSQFRRYVLDVSHVLDREELEIARITQLERSRCIFAIAR